MSRLNADTRKQRRILHPDQRGMILIVTLMVVLILALLGTAFLTTSGTEQQIGKNDQEITQALYVAEGGLQTAVNQLNQGLLVPPATVTGSFGDIGEFTATVTNAPPPTGQQQLVAVGYVPSQASPRAVKQIAVLFQRPPKFLWPIFGGTGITISDGTTDSYDSANGEYGVNGNVGSNGDVKSNGNITVKGISTVVNGDATAGGTVSLQNGGTVTGIITNSATPPVAIPDVACPSGGYTPSVPPGANYSSTTGDLTVTGSLTLPAPGKYYFHTVKVQGGTSLTVESGGHVDIYIGGQLTVSGGSVVNNISKLATNLTIWGCGTDTTNWTFSSGGTQAYLAIYAPNHNFTLSGGGSVYGSIIVEGTISDTGGSHIHYDEALGRVDGPSGRISLGRGSWTELSL